MFDRSSPLDWFLLAVYTLFARRTSAPEPAPEWAIVEAYQARHVGRVSSGYHLGSRRLLVEELQTDGSFKRIYYAPDRRELTISPLSEDEARAEVLPEISYSTCVTFTQPSAREGRCALCGHDEVGHTLVALRAQLHPDLHGSAAGELEDLWTLAAEEWPEPVRAEVMRWVGAQGEIPRPPVIARLPGLLSVDQGEVGHA